MSIAIIDYGVGNLRSVEKAFTTQGIPAVLSSDEEILRSAKKLVLPGVGAFAACMRGLEKNGFDRLVLDAARAGTPILGVCVGMQMLFDESVEFGVHRGLGLIPGRVERFPETVRVPQVGWNQVHIAREHPLFHGIGEDAFFYFVHSYYVAPKNRENVLGESEYGLRYASVCGSGEVLGVQFHPEKSQTSGLRLLKNFAAAA
jgi:imidazole glycerol phosphate synthase, glutamine amidotransferase subunit